MGLFVTFEGPDGSGKSTQVGLLGDWLRASGHNVLVTREPGGTRIGDAVRSILLDTTNAGICPQTEVLLFSAARSQLVNEIIRPHLLQDGIVLCDRFADSTMAYQGYGRGQELATLQWITNYAIGQVVPDLTVCLDLPVAQGLTRIKGGDPSLWDRLDREQLAFHERVREGYLALARAEPRRWVVVDATQPVAAVQTVIRQELTFRFGIAAVS